MGLQQYIESHSDRMHDAAYGDVVETTNCGHCEALFVAFEDTIILEFAGSGSLDFCCDDCVVQWKHENEFIEEGVENE